MDTYPPEAYEVEEDLDDIPSNPTDTPGIADIVEQRLSRRGLLKSAVAAAAAAQIPLAFLAPEARADGAPTTLGFTELERQISETHHVSPGYDADVLLRWGDPVLGDAPAFDPARVDAASQAKQFGYNNDFIAFMPLPFGSQSSDHGLLCVNHEYCDPQLMFDGGEYGKLTAEQAAVDMAASGHSVVEIRRTDGKWAPVAGSRYNRRITGTTPLNVTGPAAGHDRLKTAADPSGRRVLGTLNNCAGGVTPWGTVLIAEENFNKHFTGDPSKAPEADKLKRYGFGRAEFPWGAHVDRFDLEQHPNEANRFGWVCELDPYDPTSTPIKRTALGRFKHEGATVVINRDGRVVVYMGDDERFDYVYRFVSHGRYDADARGANRDLLDSGTLFVARFLADGTLRWMPLVSGAGPLTPENGFYSQADVLIDVRQAADLLGATPMDRPEDVEPSPATGAIYVMLTNNTKRKAPQVDRANPRPQNAWGHIIEMRPPGRGADADHGALIYQWDILLRAGDPEQKSHQARYHPDVTRNGWLACPDNAAFDHRGRLWISTDGAPKHGVPDGMWATDVEGPGRALTRMFFTCPRGAEMCGPCFTPDGTTLFVAVQHPAEERESTFARPTTRWPDFDERTPPRPSVVAITRQDGGEIGD